MKLRMRQYNVFCSRSCCIAGIAFLSGGQSGELASAHLNAMNVRYKSKLPWPLTFSFARAIQQPAMEIWHGKDDNVPAAQEALYHRAKCNQAARQGCIIPQWRNQWFSFINYTSLISTLRKRG